MYSIENLSFTFLRHAPGWILSLLPIPGHHLADGVFPSWDLKLDLFEEIAFVSADFESNHHYISLSRLRRHSPQQCDLEGSTQKIYRIRPPIVHPGGPEIIGCDSSMEVQNEAELAAAVSTKVTLCPLSALNQGVWSFDYILSRSTLFTTYTTDLNHARL